MDALTVQPCSQAVARSFVLRYHYSRSMPVGKLGCYAAIEAGRPIGVVIFGRGASPGVFKHFKMAQNEMCELTRVALVPRADRQTETSAVVAAALRCLHRDSPGIRMVVSYADETTQDHLGVIYQASNWLYLGARDVGGGSRLIGGKSILHNRAVGSRYGTAAIAFLAERSGQDVVAATIVRHRYVYAFDRRLRRELAKRAEPYPRTRAQERATPIPSGRARCDSGSPLPPADVAS